MNTESIFTAWLGIMYPCRETCLLVDYCLRRVWRYQRGNQNPYIEEEQTTQWLKEKLQKDKQRSSNKKNHGCQAGIVTWGFASLLNRKIPPNKNAKISSNFLVENYRIRLCDFYFYKVWRQISHKIVPPVKVKMRFGTFPKMFNKQILCFMCMFCRSLFVPLYFFFLAIVLSVLRFTDSDYLPLISSSSSCTDIKPWSVTFYYCLNTNVSTIRPPNNKCKAIWKTKWSNYRFISNQCVS
jgi:hypothetical protein